VPVKHESASVRRRSSGFAGRQPAPLPPKEERELLRAAAHAGPLPTPPPKERARLLKEAAALRRAAAAAQAQASYVPTRRVTLLRHCNDGAEDGVDSVADLLAAPAAEQEEADVEESAGCPPVEEVPSSGLVAFAFLPFLAAACITFYLRRRWWQCLWRCWMDES